MKNARNPWKWLLLVCFLLIGGPVFSGQADDHPVRIHSITITGNRITREKIILRELLFAQGDQPGIRELDSLIARSKQNLLNTLLFHFVEISRKLSLSEEEADIEIHVTERWYVWPVPILKISDRNFNVWWETKDFSRLSYGFYIDWRNFRGRKENLSMKFQWGYNRVVQLDYLIPYVNRNKTIGMGYGAGYSRQRETAYRTIDNRQEFFRDPETYATQKIFAYAQLLLRRNIHNSHLVELRYDDHRFSDSLIASNLNYTLDSASRVRYFSFSYLFKHDHRDYKPYPLEGHYLDAGIIKHGLWNFENNTLNTFQFLFTLRKFWKLDPRVYVASGLNGQVSAGYHPYFILGGIGFDRDIVRSYEYYLVNARHFLIWKNNVKFALIPEKVVKINQIRSDNFNKLFYALYLNVFFDGGYGAYRQDYGRETNDLQNALLLGYGAGLDFVTYYDVVLRLEYSVNFLNEGGLFLHFRAPI